MEKYKYILITSLLLLLSACSSNTSGVENGLYKDGEEVINIIDQLNNQGEYILDEDNEKKMQEFTTKYPRNTDGSNKTKDEQFIYDIYHLAATNDSYMLAYEDSNVNDMDKHRESFKSILNKIKADYGIEISEK